MSVLLIAEHDNKEVRPFTLNAITAASQIDQDLHVLVIGHNADAVVKFISEVPNVKKIIHVDNEIYQNYKSEISLKNINKNACTAPKPSGWKRPSTNGAAWAAWCARARRISRMILGDT